MTKHGSLARLAVAAAASLLLGVAAAPAYGSDAATVDVEQAGASPTDPTSLVNDPSLDELYYRHTQHTVSLAADGSDLIATFVDGFASPTLGYSRSSDGGRSWQDQGAVSTDATYCCGASVATDHARGAFYLAASTKVATRYQVEVFRTAAGGGPLGSPVTVAENGSGPALAVDDFPGEGNGTVYLGYTYYAHSEEYVLRSDDGGETWGPPGGTLVSDDYAFGRRLVVTPDHCLHYFYGRGRDVFTDLSIAVQTSCDGGASFGAAVEVVALHDQFGGNNGDVGIRGNQDTDSAPQVAVNPVTGALYVVYNEWRGDRRADVLLTTSTDGGATWSTPTVVSDDVGEGEQFSPAVAVSDDGTRLLVTFYDRRRDAEVGVDTQRWGRNAAIDTSTDTVQLTNEFQLGPGFPPAPDHDSYGGEDFFSAYEAVAFADDAFVPAWTDNRDGDDLCKPTRTYLCNYQSDIRAARVHASARTHLVIETTAPEAGVRLGEEYSYTATVSNDSNRRADNVWVRSELPLAARYVTATTNGAGPCYRVNRDVSCKLGALAPDQNRSVTITAQALASGPLKRKAVTTTSTPQRRAGDGGASADGSVAQAPTTTETFSTGDLAVPFSRGREVVVPLTIAPSPGIALDVNVMLRLESRNLDTLSMTLVSPSGRRIDVSSDNGRGYAGKFGSGPTSCAGRPAVFDDAATLSVMDNDTPFAPEANNPEGALSDLAGEAYSGQWQLVIGSLPSGEGNVGCVKLQIRHTTS